MQIVPFSDACSTDLRGDAVYRGGRMGNAGDDPLPQRTELGNFGAGTHPAISAMRLAIRLAAAFSGSFARCAYLAVVSTLL